MPPGPTGLPILGYRPFLGSHPHLTIAKLGKKYGNVFTLKLGLHNVVILNDWAAVKDAFHKEAFNGRPDYTPFTMMGGEKSLASTNGTVWREDRRFTLHLLKDLGFGKGSMEDKIIEEIGYLIERLDATDGQPLKIRTLLTPNMSNNICRLVFGHRFDYDDPKRSTLDELFDSASTLLSQTGMLSLSPEWFGKLFFAFGAIADSKRMRVITNLFEDEIKTHEKNFYANNRRDYIEGYLAEMEARKKKEPNNIFTRARLLSNARDIFGAGTETVRTATEWAFLFIAQYTEHQKRILEEIDCVIGRDRMPTYADRNQMPFTQAFINEMFRYKSFFALNVMRRTIEDTTVLGHFIPKDTYVLANIWAVHNDPSTWDNPEVFNPNRFLTEDGKQLIKTEALIPFSIGKRSCAGETLGRVELFLYFIALLQRYTISVPNDLKISFEDTFGLTLQPRDDVILQFVKHI